MTAALEILPAERRRVLISVNPLAVARSRDDLIQRLVDALDRFSLVPEVISDVPQLTQEAHDPELRAIIAAGGDGTVAFVANRIPCGAPVAILPLGTENLLAKYLGLHADPTELAETVAAGVVARMDAGQAGERLFLLMAGIGFDADVVRRLHRSRRGHISHLAYVKPIFDTIRTYQYPQLDVECVDAAGATRHLTARWVFVVNVPRYAGGLAISPDASPDDGLLNVCAFRVGSLVSGLVYLSGILLGQHQSWDDFVTLRASHVRISAAEEVPYQLDGDPGGSLPVDIRILPRRLTLIVPERFARQHAAAQTP